MAIRRSAIMATRIILIAFLLFISLVAQASSQGYMGTVTTGTGILPPLTVGKEKSSASSVGALSSLANLTGSWSVDLKGDDIMHLDLQMFQESDMIMGSGNMNAGGSNLIAAAAGSVAGDNPILFIYIIDNSEVFRLELSTSGTTLVGDYQSLSATGGRKFGTVTGSMVLTSLNNQPMNLGKATNPSATSGAWVGEAVQSQNGDSSSGLLTGKKSIYKSSTGQGTTTISDGTQVVTSY
jgi:hypothetical protein